MPEGISREVPGTTLEELPRGIYEELLRGVRVQIPEIITENS